MSEPGQQQSDLVEIAKRNGDFKRNYGTLVGAFLYLRSLSAARGASLSWPGVILGLIAAAMSLVSRLSWKWP